jgi:hypothetical protein
MKRLEVFSILQLSTQGNFENNKKSLSTSEQLLLGLREITNGFAAGGANWK